MYRKVLSFIFLISLFSFVGVLHWGKAKAQTPIGETSPVKPLTWGEQVPVPLEPITPVFEEYRTPGSVEYFADWQQTVFQSYRDGNWEIYASLATGANQTRLTYRNSYEVAPRLNPELNRVLYYSDFDGNSEIYVMNIDGSAITRLTINDRSDYYPDWSPDGSKIVFASNRDAANSSLPGEIYTMNADGTGVTRLTFTYSGAGNTQPTWSPDGSLIAWVQYQDIYGVIWVMNADGSNPHAITGYIPYLGHPGWVPWGQMISFDGDVDGDTWNELAMVNLDGTGLQEIYDAGGSYRDMWAGDWSNDGSRLAFTHVNYVLYGGQLYLESTYAKYIQIGNSAIYDIATSGYDMKPDWRPLDTFAPVSQVASLPEFSRASGFDVFWSGYDVGPSGLSYYGTYMVQYRLGAQGTWLDLLSGQATSWLTNATTHPFSSDAAEIVNFRSRAVDNAENWEAFPPGDGDAWTKMFVWLLQAAVRDSRGYPVPNAAVTVTPSGWETSISTDLHGQILTHLRQSGDHSIEANHSGYAALQAVSLYVSSDQTTTQYLPPEENLLLNGNFEASPAQLENWSISGTLAATMTTGYSGDWAANIGEDCFDDICLSASEQPYTGYFYSSMAADSLGNIHVVWDHTSYSMRSPDGNWSEPYNLGDFGFTGLIDDMKSAIEVDAQNTVHILIVGPAGIYYLQKPYAGTWSSPELIAYSHHPAIDVDNQGNAYITYYYDDYTSYGIYFNKRSSNGSWGMPVYIAYSFGRALSDIAVGADGVAHIAYRVYEGTGYRSVLQDGTLTPPQTVFSGGSSQQILRGDPQIGVDSQGMVHILTSAPGFQRLYMTLNQSGQWSDAYYFPDSVIAAEMVLDQNDNVHLAFAIVDNSEYIHYYNKAADASTFEGYRISHGGFSLDDVTLGIAPQSILHLVYLSHAKLTHQQTAIASQPESESIFQTITLTDDINQPTLDFMFQLGSLHATTASEISVSISDQYSMTNVFSASVVNQWEHGWIDLTPWLSQTITVTFSLHQAAGEPYVRLYLDNISLGPWLTPLISGVTPSDLSVWGTDVITITGDNFLLTPTVLLNDVTISGVEWVDAHTLRFSLSAGLAPGTYNVWVINPGGQEAVLSGGLRLGRFIYLPNIRK